MRTILLGLLCAAAALVLLSCGTDSPPTAETCGDFLALSDADQAAVGEELLSRLGDDVVDVEPDANAFASQLDAACKADPDSELATIAAFVVSVAESQGLSEYDEPLPNP
jgi:hypothetical protein